MGSYKSGVPSRVAILRTQIRGLIIALLITAQLPPSRQQIERCLHSKVVVAASKPNIKKALGVDALAKED